MESPTTDVRPSAEVRVAFATCESLPDLTHDDRLLVDPLAARGVEVEAAVWDDPDVDWAAYDLVVIRSVWDYVPQRAAFLRWARQVPRIANPADVLHWNTDKRYLSDLAAAGVPVIATTWHSPGLSKPELPESGTYVVKPAVSAGADHTRRYDLGSATGRREAAAHVEAIREAGGTAMLQPYLATVDTSGETALMFAAGTFSHAARKSPILRAPDGGPVHTDLEDPVAPHEPRPDQLAVAAIALDAVPGGADQLLYARVDLLDDDSGQPQVLELELAEPSLFLRTHPDAPATFAAAIAARAQSPTTSPYARGVEPPA